MPAGRPLPLAKLDNFSGTALLHQGGTRYMSGPTYVFTDGVRSDDHDRVYPAAAFELTGVARHDVVKVNAVRARWEVSRRKTRMVGQTTFENFQPPLTYAVRLSPHCKAAVAALKIDGGITEGLVTFSEGSPVRKCRLEFEGDPGLYVVSVEVDVQEARGERRETLKSTRAVYIAVDKEDPGPP